MRSALAVTHEIYDSFMAADDLVSQIRECFPSVRSACGILFAEPCYDWDELLPALSDRLQMSIIGCTATAQISSNGYDTLSSTLLVLGDDDCVFATAATPPLQEGAKEEIRIAFERARAQLNGEEFKVVFVFSSQSEECPDDERLAILNKLAEGKPIFGGIASDYFEFDKTYVFHNGTPCSGGMVIMLAGGNVRPKFVIRNLPKRHLPHSLITSAEGRNIYSIDNIPAYDFVKKHGADPDNWMGTFFTPFHIEVDSETPEGVPMCFAFNALDEKSGAGQTTTPIPVKTSVSIQTIQGSDILDTTRDAMETIVRDIAASTSEDYQYSTILGVTCAVRHIVLAFDQEREGELARAIFPSSLTFASFYSFGEFAPTSVDSEGAKNCLHGISIGLCAL